MNNILIEFATKNEKPKAKATLAASSAGPQPKAPAALPKAKMTNVLALLLKQLTFDFSR